MFCLNWRCWIRCTNDYDRWKTDKAANLGHGKSNSYGESTSYGKTTSYAKSIDFWPQVDFIWQVSLFLASLWTSYSFCGWEGQWQHWKLFALAGSRTVKCWVHFFTVLCGSQFCAVLEIPLHLHLYLYKLYCVNLYCVNNTPSYTLLLYTQGVVNQLIINVKTWIKTRSLGQGRELVDSQMRQKRTSVRVKHDT